jgi:hypothetical protein
MSMTPCNAWHEKIVRGLDKESGGKEQNEIADHLQACPSCQAFRDRYMSIRQKFGSVTEPELPASIREHLDREITADVNGGKVDSPSTQRTTDKPIPSRHPAWRYVQQAAAILLVGLLGTACVLLEKKNTALERDLQLARQKIEWLHTQEQNEQAQNDQQQAISDLHIRVRNLEERTKLSISPAMTWHSESPYYDTEWNGEL